MSSKALEERQAEMRARLTGQSSSVLQIPTALSVYKPSRVVQKPVGRSADKPQPASPVRQPEGAKKATEPTTFTRQELYDLVWSEPMRNLAGKYGISDRGLAKACAAANVPLPERGFWNKLQAGKRVSKRPLPPRGLGQSDEVTVGGNRWGYYRDSGLDLLNEPIPPPPAFEPDMETIRARVTAMVDKASLPKRYGDTPHPLIAKLLSADEVRRPKQLASTYPSSWDAPIFNTPFEMRRLNILHGLFICLDHCRMKPLVSGKEGRDLSLVVGDTHVSFCLDATNMEKQLERERMGYRFQARNPKDKMRLSLKSWRSDHANCRAWQDGEGDRLENHLREIVIELIVVGEQSYRDGVIRLREWRIERKAELQERDRLRQIEEERKRRERQARLEQQRIDHLLGQASALHQAEQIRAYVAAVRQLNETAPEPMSADGLNSWTDWALAQANQIDPVLSGAYKTRPSEPSE